MALQPIPQQRVIEKLDEHMSRRDYAGAERHLLYWLEEALVAGDKRGELMVRNELVGHFRKTGDKDRALEHADAALRLVDELEFGGTISAGTTFTNAATALNAFGEHERSRSLFEKAARLYEGSAHTDPRLLGGLYNNMALVCVSLGRFDEADALYEKALATMAQVEHGELEQAITYLNMADVATARIEARLHAGSGDPGKREARSAIADEATVASATAFMAGDVSGALPGRNEPEGAGDDTACADVVQVGTKCSGLPGDDAAGVDAAQATTKQGSFHGIVDAVSDDDYAAYEEEIETLLDKALELLDTPSVPHDGYYAFVCEKCAPVFAHYGYFLVDEDLQQRAKAIYERA